LRRLRDFSTRPLTLETCRALAASASGRCCSVKLARQKRSCCTTSAAPAPHSFEDPIEFVHACVTCI
jgi:hypothetical protein